jgi:hypothetical protein
MQDLYNLLAVLEIHSKETPVLCLKVYTGEYLVGYLICLEDRLERNF